MLDENEVSGKDWFWKSANSGLIVLYYISDNQSGSPKNWSFPEPSFWSSMRRKKLAGSGNEIGVAFFTMLHNYLKARKVDLYTGSRCWARAIVMLPASSRPTNQPANQPMQAYLTSHYFRKKKMQCKPWPRSKLACPPSTRRRCLISCAQSFARITLVKCSYNDTPVLIVKKEKNRKWDPPPLCLLLRSSCLLFNSAELQRKCYNRFGFWGSWSYSQTHFSLEQ